MTPLAVLAELEWQDATEWLAPPVHCAVMRRRGGALEACGRAADYYLLGRCDDSHAGRFPACAMHTQQLHQHPERFGCPVGRCDATMHILRQLPI